MTLTFPLNENGDIARDLSIIKQQTDKVAE